MSIRKPFTALLLGAAVLGGAVLTIAQQPNDDPRPTDRAANNQTNNANERTVDSQLAECLAIDNQGEVAISELAIGHAQNEEVKKFAEQMVQDHNRMLEQLAQFYPAATRQPSARREGDNDRNAAGGARDRDRDRNRNDASAPGTAGDETETARNAGQNAADDTRTERIDFLALKHELAQQCLQTHRAEIEKMPKEEFDECYVGEQIGMHFKAIDTMKVFQKYATPELRQVLTAGIDVAQKHLDHAKQLKKDLNRERVASRRQPAAQ